ncbi:N,N-dimethylformamidase beta subunit family domain-containing protein [Mesorhizobium sp. B4-1-4]|uniref:N,N-dimethylformamidase beta subunit family domain-containing protein n=1 Tax=Mesorhizobium sp. B4-1-4 TaxID=2589888 RepID=UPI001127B83C|nr:N,N-dimethylformamidase beta subunit family domain-containing protein [Mesorhizobium sp. B4-1-4]UCI31914.1 hypothetical protein FJW03_00005 [Mesorhizobium sp. B4-1-4]
MTKSEQAAPGVRPSAGAWPPRTISGAGEASKSTWVEVPAEDGPPAAWCYSDKRSYNGGETVRLYISSNVSQLSVSIYKDGLKRELLQSWPKFGASFQAAPERAYEVGCDWRQSITIDLRDEIAPGGYVVEMRKPGGSPSEPPLGHHIFFVRARREERSDTILLVASTCTWNAYNDWGGASHYRGLHPDYPQGACPNLSAQRPWARGQVWLPPGAPRNIAKARPRQPAPPNQDAKNWAYANGYARYFASTGWATYERPFLVWAEDAGYRVHIIPQDDLDSNPACIEGYACLAFVGHDEYWSRKMRETIDAWVESGGKIARFAGNFTWQIRLSNDRKSQTCYKYLARERDQFRDVNPALMTGAWEDPIVGYPGAETFGVNALRGMYAGIYSMAPRSSRGFNVFRHKHWCLANTGLGYGDMFGDEASIFSFEVDGLDYEFVDGLPVPRGTDGAPQGLEIIAMNWATKAEFGLDEHACYHSLSDADARFTAAILEGDDSAAAVERHSRGSGMIVSFERGCGEVFCAGTCEWVNGLIEKDFYVERITRNVFDRFLSTRQKP